MNEVFENMLGRRSVRAYQDKPVPQEVLEQIMQAAVYAPSGMNRQSWRFTVITNPEKLNLLVSAIRDGIHRDPNYCCSYHAPVLVIASNEKENTNGVKDCAAALENIFLAAHSLGISSCWINQLGDVCDLPEVRSILTSFGIPDGHTVCGCAALGYAAGTYPEAPARKDNTVVWVK